MIINLDIETRSKCDLLTAGGYRYAEDPSTEILCYAYKIDDAPAKAVIPEYAGLPDELYAGIKDGATIRGWNIAGFDVPVWNRTYTLAPIKPDQIDDTMDRARVVGLPGKLDRAAQFLGLQLRKDLDGHRLMMKLCKADNDYPTEEELLRLAEYSASISSARR
jgi:DNA polymerase